jgi:hypothetical protein
LGYISSKEEKHRKKQAFSGLADWQDLASWQAKKTKDARKKSAFLLRLRQARQAQAFALHLPGLSWR